MAYTNLSIAQTCRNNIKADAPDNRYGLKANGTALDKNTGLVWMRCALGQTWTGSACTGSVSFYTWEKALQAAESSVFAGLSDWRLPNQNELRSLLEGRCSSPSINTTAFPNMLGLWHWSSSPVANFSDSAWGVDFVDGYSLWYNKKTNFLVRLVRSGQ